MAASVTELDGILGLPASGSGSGGSSGRVCALTDSLFVVAWAAPGGGSSIIIEGAVVTRSGTSLANGTSQILVTPGGVGFSPRRIKPVSASRALLIFQGASSSTRGQILDVSGTTITPRTDVLVRGGFRSEAAVLTTTKALVWTTNAAGLGGDKAVVITWDSSGTITVVGEGVYTTEVSCIILGSYVLSSTQVLIYGVKGSADGSGNHTAFVQVVTCTGDHTTVSGGTQVSLTEKGGWNENDWMPMQGTFGDLGGGKYVLTWNKMPNSTYSSPFAILSVSGSTVSVLYEDSVSQKRFSPMAAFDPTTKRMTLAQSSQLGQGGGPTKAAVRTGSSSSITTNGTDITIANATVNVPVQFEQAGDYVVGTATTTGGSPSPNLGPSFGLYRVSAGVAPPLRQRQRDDNLTGRAPRQGHAKNPTSRQYSTRQGHSNTYL